MKLRAFGASDIGHVKANNEDCLHVGLNEGLFIVCDGVGGNAAGEVASRTAVDAVVERLTPWIEKLREMAAADTPEGRADVLALLEDAVRYADGCIDAMVATDPMHYRGMATTLDLLLVTPDGAFIAHIGDSRVYLVRGGAVTCLTTDHTVENMLLKQGRLTPEEIAQVPRKNALARVLGIGGALVDSLYVDLCAQDRFVVCSDGLARYCESGQDMIRLVQQGVTAQSANGFIHWANDSGGKDNTTAILVIIDDPGSNQQRLETWRKISLLQKATLFKGLSEQELLKVLPLTSEATLEVGTEVVHEGDSGTEMFILLEGQVEVEAGGVVLTTLGPGQQFGEQALVDSRPRSASIRTTEPSRILRLRRRDFQSLTRGELAPKLLWNLIYEISERLRTTSWQLSESVKAYHQQ